MPPCPECHEDFLPDRFYDVCNLCGSELRRQYDRMQDFDSKELTIATVTGRALFGVTSERGKAWRVG